jgi:hypothetical protein
LKTTLLVKSKGRRSSRSDGSNPSGSALPLLNSWGLFLRKSFWWCCWVGAGLPKDGRESLEHKPVHWAQNPGVVGVYADEQADAGSDEKVNYQKQSYDLHIVIL